MEFWKGLADALPQWLYFDSKVTTYPELSQLNPMPKSGEIMRIHIKS